MTARYLLVQSETHIQKGNANRAAKYSTRIIGANCSALPITREKTSLCSVGWVTRAAPKRIIASNVLRKGRFLKTSRPADDCHVTNPIGFPFRYGANHGQHQNRQRPDNQGKGKIKQTSPGRKISG